MKRNTLNIGMIMSTPLPAREGIGFYVWNLAQQLVQQGHQVQIITRGRARRLPRESVAGITIWRPPFFPVYPLHVHVHGLFVNALLKRLEPQLDVIHLHTPLVAHPRTHLPMLVTVHTPMRSDAQAVASENLLGHLVKWQAPISISLEKNLFAGATQVVAVAASVAQELTAYGIARETVAVLGNGADTTVFYPDGHGPDLSQNYFLTAGRLGPRKGLNDLIACAKLLAAQHPDAQFYIAGAGPLESELRAAIRRLGLQRHVKLLGHITDRRRLADLYRRARAYIHPAHYEGLPTVLLEAMACGAPVISTAVSGALDVVENGRNGLLVPAKSPLELAQAAQLILEDADLSVRLGKAAAQTIAARFSWHVISRRYLTAYQTIAQAGGR